jgi:amidohydrolase
MVKKILFFLLFSSIINLCLAQKFDKQINKLALQYEEEVINLRHWFHEHAELSNREFKTAERIAAELKRIGYEPQTGIAKTGVVAILKGGKPGPVVALRADIDGLPVKERGKLKWASNQMGDYNGEQVPVMHACGHDTHISILLGVAKMLYEIRDQVPGTVKFIFQPAEEGAPIGEEGGAKLMVKEGVLENPHVDVIFGLHISADTPVGEIEVKPKGIMAAVNSFRIDIKGVQSHGAYPWESVDPIVTAAQMINSIQTIVSRNSKLIDAAAVVTVGAIHAGVRDNIIPEDLYMLGTIRALDAEMKTIAHRRLREIVDNIAKANNAKATLKINEGYPITYNEPGLYNQMLPTLRRVAGVSKVKIINAVTGAEDFSFFQEKVPGLYFFIGGSPAGNDPKKAASHHTPDFYVDDSGMLLGMKAMTALTLDYMKKK